jgi:hypothetical protein
MALVEAQVVANELERVEPTIPTLFDRDDVFYSSIEKKNVETVSARTMRVPLELRPGGRFGMFDPDGGDLGVGEGPSFDKAQVDTFHMRYAVQWTKKAEWATDDARKSVLNTLKHLLAKAMPEFRRNVDALCMTGGNGVLGTVSAPATTAGGKDTLTLATDGFGVKLLRYGQAISIYDTGLTTRRTHTGLASFNGYAPIDFYDLNNKQIRVAGTTGATTTGDKVVVEGTTTVPPTSIMGVPYHHNDASTGFWLGFDRSATPEIRANRVNANNGGLALPLARLAVNKIGDRVGISQSYKPVAWMHPCQVQAYEELGQLVSMIMKQAAPEKLNLYFGEGMQLAGAAVKPSYLWDKTRIDFVISEVWGRAEMHPAKFYDVDGRRIFEIRGATGGVATSQIFYITASFNLFVNNPAACSYIASLAVPSGY